MSIQTQIDRIEQNVSNTYSVLADMGATMPEEQNTNNLPSTAANITAVLYGKPQDLTEEQKAQARANLDLEINYDESLAFDVTEIVIGTDIGTNTTSVLGQAILGQMVLA